MIEELIKELRKDKSEGSLYHVYQCNIAMQFQDEFKRFTSNYGPFEAANNIHRISNNAAKNFLDLLIRVEDEKETLKK